MKEMKQLPKLSLGVFPTPVHRLDNISRLLAFYFSGPLDPGLTSPFPAGCKVLAVHQDEGQLTVSVNPILAAQSELDITVACACLAMTCFEIIEAEQITVVCGDRSVTIRKDNLLMNSSSGAISSEGKK